MNPAIHVISVFALGDLHGVVLAEHRLIRLAHRPLAFACRAFIGDSLT